MSKIYFYMNRAFRGFKNKLTNENVFPEKVAFCIHKRAHMDSSQKLVFFFLFGEVHFA